MARTGWQLLKKQLRFVHPYMQVEEWRLRLPNGKNHNFLVEGAYSFVVVVGLTTVGTVLLVDQYYVSQGRRLTSLIMGIVDKPERPAATARRELMEEAGATAKKFIPLGTSIKGKYMLYNVYYYLALGVEQVAQPKLESSEDITVRYVRTTQLQKMVEQQKFLDVYAETGATRALRYMARHKNIF